MPKQANSQIADQITFTLLRVINKIEVGRRIPREFGEAGSLTLIEAEMCQIISRNKGITGSEIAKQLGVTHSATSQALSKMRTKGLIREEFVEGDAKRKLIYLTPVGSSAAKVAQSYYEIMQKELYGTSNRELLAYLRFVSKLENFHNTFHKLEAESEPKKAKK